MSSYIMRESLCDSILRLHKSIQSVAIINNHGKVIEKISRPAFIKQFPNHLNELFCMSCVLQISMGKDFDENYGTINYYISERSNLTIITFPLDKDVILITTNKNISPVTLAKKTVDIINNYVKQLLIIEKSQ